MKKFEFLCLIVVLLCVLFSCYDEDNLEDASVIIDTTKKENAFDKWLEANYVNPYNISFKYRYEEIESDFNYYTVPAELNQSIEMAHIVKYICMESYDEVAGIDFTRMYFPKEFFLIGEWEYLNNGTFILGTAEGGKKILLSGINYLDDYKSNITSLTYYYLKTIHHEFTHILNQTKEMPVDFQYVTGTDYVSYSWSDSPYEGYNSSGVWNNWYYGHGFISDYAQQEYSEDFAEMLSIYVCYPESYWQEILDYAKMGFIPEGSSEYDTSLDAASLLETKLSIVKTYMRDSWGIDIDELRDVIQRRASDLENNKIDLLDLTV